MRKRIVVGIWMLIAGSVSIAFPLVAHAQPSAESEISCDAPDALQHALMTIPAGGRIIVRAGTCTGNFMLSRDIRIQGSGLDQVTLRAADPAQPVVTVPRGITATISGVTIAGGRVGVLVIGRSSLAFTMVTTPGTDWPLWLFWAGVALAVLAGTQYLLKARREVSRA